MSECCCGFENRIFLVLKYFEDEKTAYGSVIFFQFAKLFREHQLNFVRQSKRELFLLSIDGG